MIHSKKRYLIIAIAAGIFVFSIMAALLFMLINSKEKVDIENQKLNSLSSASRMTAYVKFTIEESIILLKGYNAYITTNPDISEEKTIAYLDNLIGDNNLIKNVGVIKDTTIIFNYPKEGNQKAIGTDLAKIPEQKDDLLKVKNTLNPIFFGPINLVQGGQGYIARIPIILEGKYWGQISIVLKSDEFEKLFQEYAKDNELEIAMFKGDASSQNIIFGDINILGKNPIISTVSLLGTDYKMASLDLSSKYGMYQYLWMYILSILFSLMLAYMVFKSFMNTSRIKVQASKDKLTMVYNRGQLDSFIKDALQQTKKNGTELGIIVMDIDNFKATNDIYGHLAGDVVLRKVASSMLALCKKTETVFRMGGDEFMIVFHDVSGRESFETITDRIMNMLPSTVIYQNQEIPLSLSLGFALYPKDGKDFDTLFKCADDKMYINKMEAK